VWPFRAFSLQPSSCPVRRRIPRARTREAAGLTRSTTWQPHRMLGRATEVNRKDVSKYGTVPGTACQITIVVPIPSFACALVGEKWPSTLDLAVPGIAGESRHARPKRFQDSGLRLGDVGSEHRETAVLKAQKPNKDLSSRSRTSNPGSRSIWAPRNLMLGKRFDTR
jgi:hypothetical protein